MLTCLALTQPGLAGDATFASTDHQISLHRLQRCSRISCLAAGKRCGKNDSRRTCGTPACLFWYRNRDGAGDSNNTIACNAVLSLDWLCRDFGSGPVVRNWAPCLLPGFCVQFHRCAYWNCAGVDRAHLLGKDEANSRSVGAVLTRHD